MTTFAIIDGAARIRATFAGGRTVELDHVVAWDRRGDWVLFPHALDMEPLALAPEGKGEIGDRCYSLNVPLEGSRVLAEGQIVGLQDFPEVGDRLSVSFVLAAAAHGSPVVNSFGEVIGLAVFPGTWPGLASLNSFRLVGGQPFRQSVVGMATPVRQIPIESTDVPVPLSTLLKRGVFLQPLVKSEHIGQAHLLREIDEEKIRKGMVPMIGEFEFSQNKGKLFVFVYWNPLEELETDYRLEVYNLDNRRLLQGEIQSLKLKAYTRSHTWWDLDIGNLRPSIYRVDLMMGGQAIWRTFFKIVE